MQTIILQYNSEANEGEVEELARFVDRAEDELDIEILAVPMNVAPSSPKEFLSGLEAIVEETREIVEEEKKSYTWDDY